MKQPDRYRLYIDECGDPGLSAASLAQDRYLTLVGVAFETTCYRDVFQPALEAMKKRHLAYDADDPPVLHKDDIVKKRRAFSVLRDAALQQAFDADLLQLLSIHEYCVVCVVVDKLACVRAYGPRCPEPYEYAMAALLVRYAGWLNYVVHGVGDVMAEARYKKADRSLSRAYQDVYVNGTTRYPGPRPIGGVHLQKALTSRNLKLKEKRDNVAGLQVADLLTYCCKVDTLGSFGRPAPVPGPFSQAVQAAIAPKYNRRAGYGTLKGYGQVFITPGGP